MGGTLGYRVPSIFEVVIITDTETKSIYGIIYVLTGFNGGYFPDTSNIGNVNQSTTKFHVKKLKNKFTNTSTMKSKFFKIRIESSSQSQLEADISTLLNISTDASNGYNINNKSATYTCDAAANDHQYTCSNYTSPFALSVLYDDTYSYHYAGKDQKYIIVIDFLPVLINRFVTSISGYTTAATLGVYTWAVHSYNTCRIVGVELDNIDQSEFEMGTTTLTASTSYTIIAAGTAEEYGLITADISDIVDEISTRTNYGADSRLGILIYMTGTESEPNNYFQIANCDSDEDNTTYLSYLSLEITFPSDYPFWINITQTAESNNPNKFWAEFEVEARWGI